MSKDYYQILGISKSASDDEIKRAYRKLAMKHHPDRNQGDKNAEQKFKELSEAYDVLKDPNKKSNYDSYGHDTYSKASQSGGFGSQGFGHGGMDFNSIFEEFFGQSSSRGTSSKRSSKVRGADLKYRITISLEEAFKGVEQNISFKAAKKCNSCNGTGSKTGKSQACRNCKGRGSIIMQQGFLSIEQTCPHCHGVGQVLQDPCGSCRGQGRSGGQHSISIKIPSGVENKSQIHMIGEGEAGAYGGASGDLYIVIFVKEHNKFAVDNADLYYKARISFTTAALGAEITVPLIEGGEISVRIPAGTQNGDRLKISNKGMSKIRSSSRGNLYIKTYITIPKKLSKKQKELLREFDLDENNSSQSNLFDKIKNIWSLRLNHSY